MDFQGKYKLFQPRSYRILESFGIHGFYKISKHFMYLFFFLLGWGFGFFKDFHVLVGVNKGLVNGWLRKSLPMRWMAHQQTSDFRIRDSCRNVFFFSKNVGPKTRFIEEGEIASLVRGEIAPVAYLEGH